ncbi:MAG: response regulator [Candidatus Hydrogenedentes bacterium]|nr:response regulator [Candidatus Hydrogenedentota bacterium]
MGINILVVDDSQIIRGVVIKTLSLSGLEIGDIYEASNGKEALEILKNNWIDLILTDINMPVMNGIELINEISKDELLKTIPIAIISTEGSRKRVEDLENKGVKAYLRKPFTPESLKNTIIDLLKLEGDRKND